MGGVPRRRRLLLSPRRGFSIGHQGVDGFVGPGQLTVGVGQDLLFVRASLRDDAFVLVVCLRPNPGCILTRLVEKPLGFLAGSAA